MHHIDFHITIPFYWTVEQAHTLNHAIEDQIAPALDHNARVMVHLDPCKPVHCSSCQITPCAHRSSPFASLPDWSVETLTAGQQQS
jgi:hypothetical protein